MMTGAAKTPGTRERPRRSVLASLQRLPIARKMLLGFGVVTGLVFTLAVANLVTLQLINRVNAGILNTDVPLLEASERMIQVLLDEELFARRAAILGSEELMRVSQERGEEFRTLLSRIERLPESHWVPAALIGERHAAYVRLLAAEPVRAGTPGTVDAALGSRILAAQEQLIEQIKEVSRTARQNQYARTSQVVAIGSRAFQLMAIGCSMALLLSAVATLLLTRSITGPLGRLKKATERIAGGRFDSVPDIGSGDEIGDLSQSFSHMARRLKRLEEASLDASPLTRLPGGIAIENLVQRRLARREPFAFCLVDLDNFKAFSDSYGYARGSELIKATGRLIVRVVRECGHADDFIGHIGGDDFVVVSTPERFRDICAATIAAFDAEIGSFYDPEDLRRGHLVAKNRQGQEVRFPITTISIAVVTNVEGNLENPIQIGEIAAELKEYAKSLEGSVYVVDHRRREAVHGRGEVVPFAKPS